jgi:hypothetical protein
MKSEYVVPNQQTVQMHLPRVFFNLSSSPITLILFFISATNCIQNHFYTFKRWHKISFTFLPAVFTDR